MATIGQPFSLFIKESYLILGLNRVALFSIYFIVLRMIVWIQWPSVRFGTSRTDCIACPPSSSPALCHFASAHPARTASSAAKQQAADMLLCLSTSHTDCIGIGTRWTNESVTLPQHIPHGLHQQNRTDAMPQIHAICCELVDSFSDAAKAASALTIFPCSSTAKAIYIAIIDSLGRTIDRFSVRTAPKKSVSLRFA